MGANRRAAVLEFDDIFLAKQDHDEGSEKLTEEKIMWHTFIAEADVYLKNCDYVRAEEYYTKALRLQPDQVHVLHLRSKCRANLGETANAFVFSL
jgi:hypothetical protein